MKSIMIPIPCPVCGRKLLATRIRGEAPRVSVVTDDAITERMDTKLKCPRCKTIVGIEK